MKYKTINNYYGRAIVRYALKGNVKSVALMLYNIEDKFEETTYERLFKIAIDFIGVDGVLDIINNQSISHDARSFINIRFYDYYNNNNNEVKP